MSDWASLRSFAALHALGALDGEELVRLRSEIPGLQGEAKNEYRNLLRAAQLLWLAAPQQPPPPELKKRILDRIGRSARGISSQVAHRSPSLANRMAEALGLPVQRLLAAACLILLALCLGLTAWLWQTHRGGAARHTELERAHVELSAARDTLGAWRQKTSVLDAPQLQMVSLRSAGAGAAWGAVFWDPAGGSALLRAHGLPAKKNGAYVFWVAVDGKPMSALRFQSPGLQGEFFHIAKLPESDRRRINAFMLTHESDGKNAAPGPELWLEGSPLL